MEHLLAKEGVAGSIPVSRLKKERYQIGIVLFFEPCQGSKVRCLRSAPVRAGRGPPDLVRRLALFSCLHAVVDNCRQLILQRVPVGSLPPASILAGQAYNAEFSASTNRTASGKMTNFFEKIMRHGTRTQRRWFSVAPRRSAHLRFQRLRLSVRGRISCCRKPPVKINLFFISSYLYVEKNGHPSEWECPLEIL